jgi:hypothetical protein
MTDPTRITYAVSASSVPSFACQLSLRITLRRSRLSRPTAAPTPLDGQRTWSGCAATQGGIKRTGAARTGFAPGRNPFYICSKQYLE